MMMFSETVNELWKDITDGSVLAKVLFDDGDQQDIAIEEVRQILDEARGQASHTMSAAQEITQLPKPARRLPSKLPKAEEMRAKRKQQNGCDGDSGGREAGEGGSSGDGPYAEISEENYEHLASAWHKENAAAEQQRQRIWKPPLNPQQGAVTRDFLRVVENVQHFKKNQDEPATFQQQLLKDGLGLALLIMGAGGTGKSMAWWCMSSTMEL